MICSFWVRNLKLWPTRHNLYICSMPACSLFLLFWLTQIQCQIAANFPWQPFLLCKFLCSESLLTCKSSLDQFTVMPKLGHVARLHVHCHMHTRIFIISFNPIVDFSNAYYAYSCQRSPIANHGFSPVTFCTRDISRTFVASRHSRT